MGVAKLPLDFCVFREFDPETDYNCVLSDWAKSYRSSLYAGPCPNHLWHEQMKSVLDGVLDRGAYIVMAVADDDRDHILGWACFERSKCGVSVVHYVFVKDDWREEYGLGRTLLQLCADGFYIYTCSTKDGSRISQGGKFVPSIIKRKNLEPIYAEARKNK
jgi:hypothetical protein